MDDHDSFLDHVVSSDAKLVKLLHLLVFDCLNASNLFLFLASFALFDVLTCHNSTLFSN